MDPSRRKWDDDELADQFARIDRKFEEIDALHKRTQRQLRNRPTKRQVNARLDELTGAATRGQIWVAAIGGAALVIAAIVSGVIDIFNSPPIPPTK